jgi:pseudouridine kinase
LAALVRAERRVWVVGGLAGDVTARSANAFTAGSSNPGRVERGPGGVGRNIAHCLGLLGIPTALLSAAGDDYEGTAILRATADAGVEVSAVARLPGRRTGAYISLLDEAGELVGAVADMEINAEITPRLIESHRRELSAAHTVVADTNLPVETLLTLSRLCSAARVPLIIEPVSVAKARRLRRRELSAAWMAPNRRELESIFDRSAEALLSEPRLLGERGPESASPDCAGLLLSLGAEGAAVVGRDTASSIRRPAFTAQVRDVNGAGDGLLAGFVAGLWHGEGIEAALEYGLAVAAITVASPATVAPELSPEAVARKRREG